MPPFFGNMQDFTREMCESYCLPIGANYVYVGKLRDDCDGKKYEVRKFADGRCWMVDNLMYGGVVDQCAGKAVFEGKGIELATHQFGYNTYGDCRDPRVGGDAFMRLVPPLAVIIIIGRQ